MKREEKLLNDFVNYFYYLDSHKKSYNWNIGYFKKLKKLLLLFLKEYITNRGGWL